MIEKIIGVLIIGGIGAVIAIFGRLIWKKEMLSLMHDYHVDKVSAENRPAFCKRSGIGLIVIGTGLLITAVILGFTDSAYSFLCFAICLVIGLILLITAGTKYNR